MGDSHKIYKKLTKSPQVIIDIPEEKKSPSPPYSIWEDSFLANRLNYAGIIISIVDEVINFISSGFPAFSDFLNSLPSYVMGLYYSAPTLLPFLPSLYALCRHRLQTDFSELAQRERLALKEQLEQDPGIMAAVLNQPELMERLLDIVQHHYKDSSQKITIIINSIYLGLHAFQGVVLMLNPTYKEEVTRWTDLISTAINIGYFFAQGIRLTHSQNNTQPKLLSSSPVFYRDKKTSELLSPSFKEPLIASPSLQRT